MLGTLEHEAVEHTPPLLCFDQDQVLANAIERIKAVGPNRVVINSRGIAVPPADARLNEIIPEVVFIRRLDDSTDGRLERPEGCSPSLMACGPVSGSPATTSRPVR